MSTRIVDKKPPETRPDGQADVLFDNVTPFPGPSARDSRTSSRDKAMPPECDDEGAIRTIDAIADHVLAARYLSAEEQDDELNRLLDLVLLRIGETIAALDGPEPYEIPSC